jgi:NitT/TauT family transport system permease protein
MSEFSRALPAALETMQSVIAGVGVGFVISLIYVLATAVGLRLVFFLHAILFLAYAIPPFATSQIGFILGLLEGLPTMIVAAAVALPLSSFLSQAGRNARDWFPAMRVLRGVPVLRHVYLPAAAPFIALGLAVCMPFAVLAAMLAELAVGTPGLGPTLFHAIQRGSANAWPSLSLAASLSLVPYIGLLVLSGALRRLYFLREIRFTGQYFGRSDPSHFGTELLYLAGVIAIMWVILHWRAPILAPALSKTASVIIGMSSLHKAVLLTIASTVIASVIGTMIGLTMALIASVVPFTRIAIVPLLLPLQALPLIVFVPPLLAFELALQGPAVIGGEWKLIPALVPSIVVGALTAAYVAYEVGLAWLLALPHGLGPLVACRSPLNASVLYNIRVPWLARAVPLVLESGLPRTFLAVMVCEYLVTAEGLGGLLYQSRGQRAFAESWAVLLTVMASTALIWTVARAVARIQVDVD